MGRPTSGLDAERALAIGVCVAEEGLRERVCDALLGAGWPVPTNADSVESFLGRCNGSSPACVVLGARRPDRGTAAAVAAINAGLNDARVVLVCQRASAGDVRRALGFGVDGVVLVDRVEAALAAVVSVVVSGQVSVPSPHRRAVGREVLTIREKQILELLVTGLTNAQIATRLYLAESTVKSHLSSAFAKLDVSSRHEAVSLILDPDRGRGLGVLAAPVEPAASV